MERGKGTYIPSRLVSSIPAEITLYFAPAHSLDGSTGRATLMSLVFSITLHLPPFLLCACRPSFKTLLGVFLNLCIHAYISTYRFGGSDIVDYILTKPLLQ